MPTYCYQCDRCGDVAVERRSIKRRNRSRPCDTNHCPGTMHRAVKHELVNNDSTDYNHPVLSDAMGVSPDQVSEHRRRFPNVPIMDDGRVIVRNHAEGRRIRKALGFFDKDGYSQ